MGSSGSRRTSSKPVLRSRATTMSSVAAQARPSAPPKARPNTGPPRERSCNWRPPKEKMRSRPSAANHGLPSTGSIARRTSSLSVPREAKVDAPAIPERETSPSRPSAAYQTTPRTASTATARPSVVPSTHSIVKPVPGSNSATPPEWATQIEPFWAAAEVAKTSKRVRTLNAVIRAGCLIESSPSKRMSLRVGLGWAGNGSRAFIDLGRKMQRPSCKIAAKRF